MKRFLRVSCRREEDKDMKEQLSKPLLDEKIDDDDDGMMKDQQNGEEEEDERELDFEEDSRVEVATSFCEGRDTFSIYQGRRVDKTAIRIHRYMHENWRRFVIVISILNCAQISVESTSRKSEEMDRFGNVLRLRFSYGRGSGTSHATLSILQERNLESTQDDRTCCDLLRYVSGTYGRDARLFTLFHGA